MTWHATCCRSRGWEGRNGPVLAICTFLGLTGLAGMATDDGAVVLNPYSPLSEQEMDAVAINEAARVVMSTHVNLRPSFALTLEQEAAFANYGPPECIKATVAARILSGDPSALTPTAEQIAFVLRLAREMGIPADAGPSSPSSAPNSSF